MISKSYFKLLVFSPSQLCVCVCLHVPICLYACMCIGRCTFMHTHEGQRSGAFLSLSPPYFCNKPLIEDDCRFVQTDWSPSSWSCRVSTSPALEWIHNHTRFFWCGFWGSKLWFSLIQTAVALNGRNSWSDLLFLDLLPMKGILRSSPNLHFVSWCYAPLPVLFLTLYTRIHCNLLTP